MRLLWSAVRQSVLARNEAAVVLGVVLALASLGGVAADLDWPGFVPDAAGMVEVVIAAPGLASIATLCFQWLPAGSDSRAGLILERPYRSTRIRSNINLLVLVCAAAVTVSIVGPTAVAAGAVWIATLGFVCLLARTHLELANTADGVYAATYLSWRVSAGSSADERLRLLNVHLIRDLAGEVAPRYSAVVAEIVSTPEEYGDRPGVAALLLRVLEAQAQVSPEERSPDLVDAYSRIAPAIDRTVRELAVDFAARDRLPPPLVDRVLTLVLQRGDLRFASTRTLRILGSQLAVVCQFLRAPVLLTDDTVRKAVARNRAAHPALKEFEFRVAGLRAGRTISDSKPRDERFAQTMYRLHLEQRLRNGEPSLRQSNVLYVREGEFKLLRLGLERKAAAKGQAVLLDRLLHRAAAVSVGGTDLGGERLAAALRVALAVVREAVEDEVLETEQGIFMADRVAARFMRRATVHSVYAQVPWPRDGSVHHDRQLCAEFEWYVNTRFEGRAQWVDEPVLLGISLVLLCGPCRRCEGQVRKWMVRIQDGMVPGARGWPFTGEVGDGVRPQGWTSQQFVAWLRHWFPDITAWLPTERTRRTKSPWHRAPAPPVV